MVVVVVDLSENLLFYYHFHFYRMSLMHLQFFVRNICTIKNEIVVFFFFTFQPSFRSEKSFFQIVINMSIFKKGFKPPGISLISNDK